MRSRTVRFVVSALALGIGGAAAGPDATRVNRAHAAELQSGIARGEPHKKTQGSLTAYVPDEIAVRGGAFDLVVHFHGASEHQEKNLGEAGLRAVVVTANEGMGSTPYARAFATPGSLDRVIALAEETVVASGRIEGEPRVGRVALSSWSAGGASVKAILEHDADRVDAVLLADGIFSRYVDRRSKEIEARPLEPLVRFARRAIAGEKVMVITHTAIETPGYPNVKECTNWVLGALDLPPARTPVYTLERGDLQVHGSAGTGPSDHVDAIRALDRAYALVAQRWRH